MTFLAIIIKIIFQNNNVKKELKVSKNRFTDLFTHVSIEAPLLTSFLIQDNVLKKHP